jgi:iron-sulfur cluster assembly protein
MAGEYGPLLNGTTIDFVEIEPGKHHFIFMNPNDANYTPPGSDSGGCGSGGCGSC